MHSDTLEEDARSVASSASGVSYTGTSSRSSGAAGMEASFIDGGEHDSTPSECSGDGGDASARSSVTVTVEDGSYPPDGAAVAASRKRRRCVEGD